tara:strand:+ start:201 stop:644 length:444 start_codon:yes stop_codon:yes gene_type:complete
MSQTLSYIRPDEEFFGVIKLLNGEEIIGRIVVTEEDGGHLAFIQDPAKVHANETVSEGRRAVAVGLKKWMVFSAEDFYIIPEDRILTIAPLSTEAILMYKYFVKSEMGARHPGKPAEEIEPDDTMGLIGKVDDHRQKLEDLFNSDKS